MKIRVLILSVFGILFILGEVQATHYMGGEITWECMPNGRYRFKMRIYRECYTSGGGNAATFGATETITSTGGGVTSITMTRLAAYPIDISPQCNTNPAFSHIICPGMPNGAAAMGAMQEYVYTSDASHPTGVQLTGVPPATGWTFSWNGCCRNPSSNVVSSSSLNWWLRAKMYAYNNLNVLACFDNSPYFIAPPITAINSGYPFSFFQTAIDNERDSLSYEWGQPMTSASSLVTNYAPGYSWDNSLPGTFHNPNNIPATINSKNGAISLQSFTNGSFITCYKVSAYKHGVLVAEIWREVHISILPMQGNNSPQFSTIAGMALTPSNHPIYTDTVIAGELLSFPISINDFDKHPDTSFQSISLTAIGKQFGTNYTNLQIGCLHPPCATLLPPPPFSSLVTAMTHFTWQTSCDCLPVCPYCTSNRYDFQFQAEDDFCPIPGRSCMTVRIIVLPPPLIPAPAVRCSEVLPNGNIKLSWPAVKDTLGSLKKLYLYRSANRSGPYDLLDSITNFSITEYTDSSVLPANSGFHYMLRSLSGCAKQAGEASDTLSTIFLKANASATVSGLVNLDWNPAGTQNSSAFSYRIYELQTPFNKVLLDSVSQTQYQTTFNPFSPPLGYIVEQISEIGPDSLGQMHYCSSVSNLAPIAYTGLEESTSLKNVRIVPNPFNEDIRIHFDELLDARKVFSMSLFAPDGSAVYQQTLAGADDYQIDLGHLKSGIYFLVLKADDLVVVAKVIKASK